MEVLKVIAEGITTSFRYPHFVQGVHPTFEMPPPATLYGHVCSAVGELIPPDVLQFAFHFTFQAKFYDYEHLHFTGDRPSDYRMNPFRREMLYAPRLTLYLDNVELEPYFRQPHYPVVLGRSQDLMEYVSIETVTLQPSQRTFFAATLLPLPLAASIGGRFTAVTMPRFIDADRNPFWDQYAILHDIVEYPGQQTLQMPDSDLEIWIDPSPDARHPYKDLQRGIIWHRWV